MQLFTMINAFDATEVTLDASRVFSGPYRVKLTYRDKAIATKNKRYSYKTLDAAFKKFNELVKNEVEAVLGEVQ